MHSPLQPWQQCHAPPPQYLGTDGYGQPVYGTPATPPAMGGVAPLQPIVARPWGMYLAGGCLGVIALIVIVIAIVAIVIGFTVALAVLGLVAVCLTICVLTLRSTLRDYRKGR